MQRWKWRAKDALRQGERVAMETKRGGEDPHWDGLGATGAAGTTGASALNPAESLDQVLALPPQPRDLA